MCDERTALRQAQLEQLHSHFTLGAGFPHTYRNVAKLEGRHVEKRAVRPGDRQRAAGHLEDRFSLGQ